MDKYIGNRRYVVPIDYEIDDNGNVVYTTRLIDADSHRDALNRAQILAGKEIPGLTLELIKEYNPIIFDFEIEEIV